MRLKVIIFLWVLCAQLIYSQSLADLYKNELPDVVFQNDEFKSTVETNLQYYTSFSPVLAGYYIEHFKKKFVEKISDNDSNYYNQLQTLRDSLLILRNDWAEEQLNELNSRSLNQLHENLVSNILDDFLTDEFFKSKNPLLFFKDERLLEYYYYKYILRKLKVDFDKNKNYSELVNAESKKIINTIDSLYHSRSITDIDSTVQFALRYRNLFSDSYIAFHQTKSDFSLLDFLQKILNVKVKESEGFFVKLRVGGLYNQIEGDDFYIIDEKLGTHGAVAKFNKLETVLLPSVSIGAGYKLKLKEEKTFLSYLTIEGDFQVFSKLEDRTDGTNTSSISYFVLDSNSIVAHNLRANYTISDRKNEKVMTFGFSVLTPLYYLTHWFHITGGINYNYIDLSYSYDISKRDELLGLISDDDDKNDYDITKNFEFNRNRIGALIGAELNLGKNLIVDFTYRILADFLFDIKYQF